MGYKQGKVSNWNDEKGYGFISSNSDGNDRFFHISEYSENHKIPINGLIVKYQDSHDDHGRVCAINVSPIKGHLEKTLASKQLRFSFIILTLFLISVGAMAYFKLLPNIIGYIYMIMSLVTFVIYANDKNAARTGKWRTPESTMHLFSLIGGWPGALIAQSKLRHKSRKVSFRFYYWLTVALNIFIISWLVLSIDGKVILELLK